jgi:HlyD family secretion protein
MEGSSPFRKKSLERLSSPERLDQLLKVIDRRSWLPLLASSILIAVILAWSVFGTVPVNVHGRGILIRPHEVAELRAPGTGYLANLDVKAGDVVERGRVLGRIRKPDLEKELLLQKAKAGELSEQIRSLPLIQRAGASDDESLEVHIRASRRLAERLREEGRQAISEERERLTQQRRLSSELCDSLETRLSGRRELLEQGILAREDLIESESDLTDSLSRLSDIDARLWDLRTEELEVEEQYLNRLERVADREQQFAEVSREIARLETLLEEEGSIVCEQDGRILEISAVIGEFLEQGDRIGSLALKGDQSGFVGLTYFTVRDGKRLKPGMTIHVTPDPVERARYGSILGTVKSVSLYPVTLAEAEKAVGNSEIAATLTSGGYRMQVVAELQSDDSTFSKFKWSSSKGPELLITAGTTTTARAAVDHRAPITFVLPIFKEAVGAD